MISKGYRHVTLRKQHFMHLRYLTPATQIVTADRENKLFGHLIVSYDCFSTANGSNMKEKCVSLGPDRCQPENQIKLVFRFLKVATRSD